MRFRFGLLIIPQTLLCACTATNPIVPAPKVVYVTVEKIVSVPKELTQHCPKEQKKDNTVGEAVRVARARRQAIDDCNDQLDKIANLPIPQ